MEKQLKGVSRLKPSLFMRLPGHHVPATFLHRPQRFLAKMRLSDGSLIVAYCANPGSLHGCLNAGSRAILWDSNDPSRKRRYTWRGIALDGVWVGTDTHLANRLVEKVLSRRLLPGLKAYDVLEREKCAGKGLRLDFVLSDKKRQCFIEVKSATVVEKRIARFPDSVTPRGLKHLNALAIKARAGYKAVLIFVAQRGDVDAFKLNRACYPAYSRAYDRAVAIGVKVIAFAFPLSPKGYREPRLLPVINQKKETRCKESEMYEKEKH